MRYFEQHEFSCRCGCGLGWREMDGGLIATLERARAIAEIPFVLRSAFRCPHHNFSVGGKPASAHLTGHAVDVACAGSDDRMTIVRAAVLAGFKRIGLASGFVHLDTAPHLPQNVIWLY